jgi:hypothetical protein
MDISKIMWITGMILVFPSQTAFRGRFLTVKGQGERNLKRLGLVKESSDH